MWYDGAGGWFYCMPHLMSKLSFFGEDQVVEIGVRVRITHQLEHARGETQDTGGKRAGEGNHQLEVQKDKSES